MRWEGGEEPGEFLTAVPPAAPEHITAAQGEASRHPIPV